MHIAAELRALYPPENPTSAQAAEIDLAVEDVTMRYLMMRPVVDPEVESTFPVLTRISEMLDQYVPSAFNEWNRAGFSISTAMFAATIGDIALLPDKAGLASALKDTYNPHEPDSTQLPILSAVQSTAATQHDPRLGEELTREWSIEFPALARIAEKLNENRPLSLGIDFDEGFYEGIHYYPAALGRLALADEDRRRFDDNL